MTFKVFLLNPPFDWIHFNWLFGLCLNTSRSWSTGSPEMQHFTWRRLPPGNHWTETASWGACWGWGGDVVVRAEFQWGKELSPRGRRKPACCLGSNAENTGSLSSSFTLTFKQEKNTIYKESQDKIIWVNVLWKIESAVHVEGFIITKPWGIVVIQSIQESWYYGGETLRELKIIVSAGPACKRNLLKNKTHKVI